MLLYTPDWKIMRLEDVRPLLGNVILEEEGQRINIKKRLRSNRSKY